MNGKVNTKPILKEQFTQITMPSVSFSPYVFIGTIFSVGSSSNELSQEQQLKS